jgi:hypothetical protein
MNTKILKTLLIVPLLAGSTLLTSCGSDEPSTPAPSATSAQAPATTSAPKAEPSAAASLDDASVQAIVDMVKSFGTDFYMYDAADRGAIWISGNGKAAVAFVTPERESASFIGSFTKNDNGTFTVTDENNGLALTFSMSDGENGALVLDFGSEIGSMTLEPTDIDTATKVLVGIAAMTTPVA